MCWESVDTSGSENQTCLVAGGPPWLWASVLAASLRLRCQPSGVGRLTWLCRLYEASGEDLLPVPDPYGEGVRPAVKHLVGAIVGLLQGRTQTGEAGRRPTRSSLGCCWSVLFLPGRKNAAVSMILENFSTICDCSFHHRSGRLVVVSAYRFFHGGW